MAVAMPAGPGAGHDQAGQNRQRGESGEAFGRARQHPPGARRQRQRPEAERQQREQRPVGEVGAAGALPRGLRAGQREAGRGDHRGDFGDPSERDDDVMARLGVLREADHAQVVPAEPPPDDPAAQLERLDAVHRHHHVAARQQAATAAQPLGGRFEPEAVVAQRGADEPGRQSHRRQHRERERCADDLDRRTRVLQHVRGFAQQRRPGPVAPDVDRQQPVELLRRARQRDERDQRELEQPECREPREVHREQRRRGIPDRVARAGCGDAIVEADADRLAQRLGLGGGDIADPDLVLAARAGLEPDLDHAEQPRHQPLFEADVLDALVRHRTRGAAEQAAFDPDVALAQPIAEFPPRQEAEQRGKQPHCDQRRDDDRPALAERAGPDQCGQRGQAGPAQRQDRGDDEAQRAGPPPFFRRGVARSGHTASRLTCARICSRIASASAWARPGSATEAL